jgi:anaerobic magnesium-protoporphyrin IX monomethyl ester cyclase
MKVCLVRPFHHSHLIQPPLALGYLAAYLQQHGHRTTVIDGLCERLSDADLAERCVGADLVGISCLSDYWPQTRELTRELKRRGLRVVLGGPHVTFVPQKALRDSGADFVVVGEGEGALLELLAVLAESGRPEGVPGVATPKHPDPVQRELLPDLNALPFPDWDQCPPAGYPPAPHGGVAKNYPIAPITSSRGCPYACSFCSSPYLWQRKIRFRDPENVVAEIEHMVLRHGVREIHFEDDNLTLKRDHVAQICEGILRRGLEISWATPNGIRCDKVDADLLALMRRSGCYSVAFGIESANPEILRRCGKKTSIDTIDRAISLASQAGLITQGFFIFGLPGETEATIQETIDFAAGSRLDKAQFLLLDVMPGCKLWEEHGHETPELSTYQSYHDLSWCPEGLDPEVLKRAPSRAFRTFFASPRRILRMLRLVKPAQLRYVLRRVADFRVLPVRS